MGSLKRAQKRRDTAPASPQRRPVVLSRLEEQILRGVVEEQKRGDFPPLTEEEMRAEGASNLLEGFFEKKNETDERAALAYIDRHGVCALCRVRVGLVFISLYVTEFKPRPRDRPASAPRDYV